VCILSKEESTTLILALKIRNVILALELKQLGLLDFIVRIFGGTLRGAHALLQTLDLLMSKKEAAAIFLFFIFFLFTLLVTLL
jgi:hypothetical protein